MPKKRRGKVCTDAVISEKAREIAAEVLFINGFGMSLIDLYDRVSKRIFAEEDGYYLNLSHFVLSIFQMSRRNIMSPFEPFMVSGVGEEVIIYHVENKKKIDQVVDKIYKQVNTAA